MKSDFELMEQKLISHEQVCAERYKGIEQQFRASNAGLKRIEVGLVGAAVALIGAMGWAINLLIGLVAKL